MGQLEEPGLSVLLRTGEGPFLIAEEFALDEIFRNGRKVGGHEGAVCPCGRIVDGGGQQLLSGAALAGDEDGVIRLEEQGTKPVPALLGEQGRQELTEQIYSSKELIWDGTLESEMERSPARDALVMSLLRLLRMGRLFLV